MTQIKITLQEHHSFQGLITKIFDELDHLRSNIKILQHQDSKDILLDESGQISIALQKIEDLLLESEEINT